MTVPVRRLPESLIAALRATGAVVREAAPLAELTTFRLGGPCPACVDAATPEILVASLQRLREAGEDPLLMGGGSNLLVRDGGIDRVAVRFVATPEAAAPVTGNEPITVSAACGLDDLAAWTVRHGQAGLVACSGIPGTVGGAVAGNAGAFGEQIGDRIEALEVLEPDGTRRWMEPDEAGFAYRRSHLPSRGLIVLAVTLRLEAGDPVELAARRAEILALRAEKHPDWRVIATAGSFFKNVEPTSRAGRRQAAGWFLEQAGAKELRVGGAHPFARHANIIVADPGATAAEVERLATDMATAVHRMFGLALEREVQIIGHNLHPET